MKVITDTWFECKVKYDKPQEDGSTKPVNEPYVVNALSFTEAEAKIMEEVSAYISGAFEVTDIKKAKYGEVFFDDTDSAADKWYRARVAFIFLDEKTAKEKKNKVPYLVQASCFTKAVENLNSVMSKNLGDYAIDTVSETNILDVFFGVGKNVTDEKPEYEQ